jgi:magnesium transporter
MTTTDEVPSTTALERLVRDGSPEDLQRFLLLLSAPEIADLLEALDSEDDRVKAFKAIVGTKRSRVLRDMEETDRAGIFERMPAAEIARLIEPLRSDDAADVLHELDDTERSQVLAQLPPAARSRLAAVLQHGEDTAGGIMQTELIRTRQDHTVRQTIETIRREKDRVGEIHEVFVTDPDGRLTGWVKQLDLILRSDETPISAITAPVPVRVPVSMDQERIAALVRDYDLNSVPVVDDQDRLVGRILVDDIVDVLEEEATEDIVRLAGTAPEEIYAPSVFRAVRSRYPWLFITFAGGIAASWVISTGEDAIRDAGILFAFMPVIMGAGGGSGNQAATVTVRSLALGRIGEGSILRVVGRELLAGLVMALATGVLLWGTVQMFSGDPRIAWIAAFAVFGTITLGTGFGVATPLLLHRTGVDPAVSASPFVSTVTDVLGSVIIVAVTVGLT